MPDMAPVARLGFVPSAIPLEEGLHELGELVGSLHREQQVEMVRHEAVVVERQPVRAKVFEDELAVALEVRGIMEHCGTIVAAGERRSWIIR